MGTGGELEKGFAKFSISYRTSTMSRKPLACSTDDPWLRLSLSLSICSFVPFSEEDANMRVLPTRSDFTFLPRHLIWAVFRALLISAHPIHLVIATPTPSPCSAQLLVHPSAL